MGRHGCSMKTILLGFCILSSAFAASSTYSNPFHQTHSIRNTTNAVVEGKVNAGVGVERIVTLPLLLLIPLLLPLLLLIPLLLPLLLLIPLLLPLLLLIPFFFSIFFPAISPGRKMWEEMPAGKNFEKFLQEKMVNLPEDISRIVENIRNKGAKLSASMSQSSSAANARGSKANFGVTRNSRNKVVKYLTAATSLTLLNRTL